MRLRSRKNEQLSNAETGLRVRRNCAVLKGREELLYMYHNCTAGFLTLCRVKIMLYLFQHLLVTHYMVWQMETPTAPMVL